MIRYYYLIIIITIYSNLQAQPLKKILLEELTGTWCGLCPSGIETMDSLLKTYPNQIIGVGVHISDPMENETSKEIGNVYSGGGVNAFLLDRYLFNDLSYIQFDFKYSSIAPKIEERLQMNPPIGVSFKNVVFDEISNTLMLKLRIEFFEDVVNASKWQPNIWITEDSVASNQQGYQQTNFFNNFQESSFYGTGNPIPYLPHRNVLRLAANGAWGSNGFFSNNVTKGSVFTYNFMIPVNEQWQLNKLALVGMIQNLGDNEYEREIINAEKIQLVSALNNDVTNTFEELENVELENKINIYPNPISLNATTNIQINLKDNSSVQVYLYNMFGQYVCSILQKTNLAKGRHQLLLNKNVLNGLQLSKGLYVLALETERERYVCKMNIY